MTHGTEQCRFETLDMEDLKKKTVQSIEDIFKKEMKELGYL